MKQLALDGPDKKRVLDGQLPSLSLPYPLGIVQSETEPGRCSQWLLVFQFLCH